MSKPLGLQDQRAAIRFQTPIKVGDPRGAGGEGAAPRCCPELTAQIHPVEPADVRPECDPSSGLEVRGEQRQIQTQKPGHESCPG